MPFSLWENGTPLSFILPPFIDLFFSVTTLKLAGSFLSPKSHPTHTHTHIHKKQKLHLHTAIHNITLSFAIVTMPLEHVVTYETFRKITNFIRNNGNDWREFCHNTSHPSTTRKTARLQHHQIKRSLTTRMPKLKAFLLLSRSSKQILIASSSSPSKTQQHLEDIQEGWSLLLDCWRNWPLEQCCRLGQTLNNGTTLHPTCSRLLPGLWWHCQQKP